MTTRTLIIGTTESADLLSRQIGMVSDAPSVVGVILIDADPGLRTINDLPVLGPIEALGQVCSAAAVAQAIVSLPAAYRDLWRTISTELQRSGVIERFVTPMDELLNSTPSLGSSNHNASVHLPSAKIDLGKLVGRQAHSIDRDLVGENITGKSVLVTGAGGSIGSELVKQIASFGPSKIILMERAENALFGVDRWLKEIHPEITRVAILHDVVDASTTLSHLERWSPDVVLHAAAHKHVPLMEDHPAHAVTNNVFGTKAIADACVATGVDRFVLISSDKAVNPVNVMGATKRIAEMYTQSLASQIEAFPGSSTKLSMVRFGNVLGSACSVLEIWADQISAGRPITVTDERMTRYFMTIPEAATLVLQAGSMSGQLNGASGEVFVLDMGEPINIFTLAQRFVRACGYEPLIGSPTASQSPDQVPIILTGSRPGEKLYEELSYDAEELTATSHPGIARFNEDAAWFIDSMDALIERLDHARSSTSRQEVIKAIASMIPTMNPHAPGAVSAA
ncbi:MAG: polysaccharide biosynthesis protein [Phycisphaerales bacterium]|nr:polysaccharide biosynthesis protein [Phycisphaerales bacterium]